MAVCTTSQVTAELDLWVPRDTACDLTSGVHDVVAALDCVSTATVLAVSDVTPRATDIRVSATVELELVDRDVDATAATLADGFGVVDATVLAVESPDS